MHRTASSSPIRPQSQAGETLFHGNSSDFYRKTLIASVSLTLIVSGCRGKLLRAQAVSWLVWMWAHGLPSGSSSAFEVWQGHSGTHWWGCSTRIPWACWLGPTSAPAGMDIRRASATSSKQPMLSVKATLAAYNPHTASLQWHSASWVLLSAFFHQVIQGLEIFLVSGSILGIWPLDWKKEGRERQLLFSHLHSEVPTQNVHACSLGENPSSGPTAMQRGGWREVCSWGAATPSVHCTKARAQHPGSTELTWPQSPSPRPLGSSWFFRSQQSLQDRRAGSHSANLYFLHLDSVRTPGLLHTT